MSDRTRWRIIGAAFLAGCAIVFAVLVIAFHGVLK